MILMRMRMVVIMIMANQHIPTSQKPTITTIIINHHHNGKRIPVSSSSEEKAILSYGGQAKGDAAKKPDLRYNQS